MEMVRSAGGVVWRDGPRGQRLAVVHRPDRRDWSLPKGRLDSSESWQEAALREVSEETGCTVQITGFAGAKLQVDRQVPKLVLYWHMRFLAAGRPDDEDEIDDVAWLTPRAALARLDHDSDRRLLMRALTGGTWRHGQAGEQVRAPRGEALRKLVVLDGRRSEVELTRYLRHVELAVGRPQRVRRVR
jgi:8-oxo-dGTP pyrophosphatase MutT (NUDIX family)